MCSNFSFKWINCLDFICITFSSTTVQTFRLRLLQIRRSNFTFLWIKCSDFICINFSSIVVQTFRLHLLHIRRSDFVFIWIRCSDFICITFSSIAVRCSNFILCRPSVQTSPSYRLDVQTTPSYRSDVLTSSLSHLFLRSSNVWTSSSTNKGVQTLPLPSTS